MDFPLFETSLQNGMEIGKERNFIALLIAAQTCAVCVNTSIIHLYALMMYWNTATAGILSGVKEYFYSVNISLKNANKKSLNPNTAVSFT